MSYTPKSEDQLIREGLYPDGVYDVTCVDTDDKPSKSGNTMFTLKIHVFDDEGNAQIVTDYIALGSNFGERKFRHAASAFNLMDLYESGNLTAADFKDKSAKAQIATQEGQNGYGPKNVVKDYPKIEGDAAPKPKPVSEVLEDDEIPF